MSTLQSRVEDYIGTFSDTTALTDWLTAGAKLVSDLLPTASLEQYTKKVSDNGSGVSVADMRILYALKNGYRARKIHPGLAAQAASSDSIHQATSTSPVYYVQDGTAYVLPSGGDIHGYTYPTVDYSLSNITNFPSSHEHTVVLYAAYQGCISKIITAINNINSETFDTVTPPTAPTAPNFIYTLASGETVSSTSITVSSSLPTYTKPVSSADFSNLDTYIGTDEDMEKANSELGQQRAKLEEFQMNLYNELNEFNKESKAYELELQKAIAQAQLTQQRLLEDAQRKDNLELANNAKDLEKQVSEYVNKLQKYQGEIAKYQSDISLAVQKLGTKVQKHRAELEAYLQLASILKAEFSQALQTIRGLANE